MINIFFKYKIKHFLLIHTITIGSMTNKFYTLIVIKFGMSMKMSNSVTMNIVYNCFCHLVCIILHIYEHFNYNTTHLIFILTFNASKYLNVVSCNLTLVILYYNMLDYNITYNPLKPHTSKLEQKQNIFRSFSQNILILSSHDYSFNIFGNYDISYHLHKIVSMYLTLKYIFNVYKYFF